MTNKLINEQILKKAIEKAYPNFNPTFDNDPYEGGWRLKKNGEFIDVGSDFDVIFSLDFAKAFWGDNIKIEWPMFATLNDLGFSREVKIPDSVNRCGWLVQGIPLWKFHLQQMVLEEDPIKYLEKFLDSE